MPVEIGELVTHVAVTDGDAALSPQAWEHIKQLVAKIIEEHERHQKQVRAEQHVTGGVSQELQEDLDN
jgi:hypothetical protein